MTKNREDIIEKMKKVYLRRESIKEKNLKLDLDNKKKLNDEVFRLGHILLDLFEVFDIPLEKELLLDKEALFNKFKTPKDIVDYIEKRSITNYPKG